MPTSISSVSGCNTFTLSVHAVVQHEDVLLTQGQWESSCVDCLPICGSKVT